MLKIKNKADAAEITIAGSIVDDEEGGVIRDWGLDGTGYEWPAEIKAQLDEVKGKPLTVYINSYGGSVAAGVAMANMIKRHDAPTTAVVDGVCCSIATQIFFSADFCQMPANAYLMIHKPTAVCCGDADEMIKTAEILDTMQEGLETSYRAKAREGVTAEDIHNAVNAETWLTGTEAAEMFDIEVTDALEAVAYAGCRDAMAGCSSIPEAIVFAQAETDAKADDDANINRRVEIALAIAKGATV